MADTIVVVSRAAQRPLPSPPKGSVWERIERARQEEGLTYGALSKEAGRVTGHYRLIATRQRWHATQEITDAFVAALVRRGFSETWLRVGTGVERTEPRSEPAEIPALSQEPGDLREDAGRRWYGAIPDPKILMVRDGAMEILTDGRGYTYAQARSGIEAAFAFKGEHTAISLANLAERLLKASGEDVGALGEDVERPPPGPPARVITEPVKKVEAAIARRRRGRGKR